MKISTKLRYAARMLLLLSETSEIMNTNEIAKRIDVSPMYLRVLANELEKKGLIESVRGAKGGYRLLKDPKKITIKDIAEIHEALDLVPCIEEPEECPSNEMCRMRKIWLGLRETIIEYLSKWSIEDIAKL